MGMGHVPQDPVRSEGTSADVQGRQRRGASAPRVVKKSLAAKSRGRFGEDEAWRWYSRNGYTLLARNWHCHGGEIDLVVRRRDVLVFCEVKSRASAEFGGPEAAVGWRKQQRVRRSAAMWLAEFRPPTAVEIRFDVAAVVGVHVTVIESAF